MRHKILRTNRLIDIVMHHIKIFIHYFHIGLKSPIGLQAPIVSQVPNLPHNAPYGLRSLLLLTGIIFVTPIIMVPVFSVSGDLCHVSPWGSLG